MGLVLAVISLLIMPALAFFKQRTGREMGSEALKADALKQIGLYADCVEEDGQPKWTLPSEAVSKEEAWRAIELAATFVVPLPDESVKLMLADASSSETVLEVLLTFADRREGFSEGQDWELLAMAPNNIRAFVEATVASIAEEPVESDGTR